VGAAFVALGLFVRWRGAGPAGTALAAGGLLLAMAGVAVPGRLTPLFRAWMGLARVLSRVTTPLFLGVVYFGVITPTGLVLRLLGRHPLVGPREGESYFVSRPAGGRRSDLTRQF